MKQIGPSRIIAVRAMSTSFGDGTATSWVDRDVIRTEVRDRDDRIVARGQWKMGRSGDWIVATPGHRR